MSAAVAQRPLRLYHLREYAAGKPDRVDREARVIYGVRVLGLVSDNGRRYTPEALRKALPLYEGAKVKINHPLRSHEERPVQSTFGWLKDVRPGPDGGIYADLHFLKAHEMAEAVCEAAERNPGLYGLSHNADGKGQTLSDGTLLVEEITGVRSVDLVDSPATNRTLFEAKLMTQTVGQIVESNAKIIGKTRDLLLKHAGSFELKEAADGGALDHKDHLTAAIGSLCKSEDPADHATAKKILALMKPDAKDLTEDDADDGKKKKKPDQTTESVVTTPDPAVVALQEQVAALQAEAASLKAEKARADKELAVRSLCESLKFTPSPTQLKAISLLESDADRRTLVVEMRRPGAPRSQGAAPEPGAIPADPKEYIQSLLR